MRIICAALLLASATAAGASDFQAYMEKAPKLDFVAPVGMDRARSCLHQGVGDALVDEPRGDGTIDLDEVVFGHRLAVYTLQPVAAGVRIQMRGHGVFWVRKYAPCLGVPVPEELPR